MYWFVYFPYIVFLHFKCMLSNTNVRIQPTSTPTKLSAFNNAVFKIWIWTKRSAASIYGSAVVFVSFFSLPRQSWKHLKNVLLEQNVNKIHLAERPVHWTGCAFTSGGGFFHFCRTLSRWISTNRYANNSFVNQLKTRGRSSGVWLVKFPSRLHYLSFMLLAWSSRIHHTLGLL